MDYDYKLEKNKKIKPEEYYIWCRFNYVCSYLVFFLKMYKKVLKMAKNKV